LLRAYRRYWFGADTIAGLGLGDAGAAAGSEP
jgi:hypothetical protein